MTAFLIDRPDGLTGGDDWDSTYTALPGTAGISLLLESTRLEGVGPRLHMHPYAETFIVRRGSASFTVADETIEARAGQIVVVPPRTPHKFVTGPEGYEAVHVHASPTISTEWLE